MGHILGMHWQRVHPDNQVDFDHIRKMQYKSFTLFGGMWDDKGFCADLLQAAPADSIFLLRDHPLSEQKTEIISDPAGFGAAHAQTWGNKWRKGLIALPDHRCYMLGVNELDTNKYQTQNDVYTTHFTQALASYGLRTAGWSFGVGHPSTFNLDPKEKPDWTRYKASAEALMRHGGIAALHEYWVKGNMGWGHWAGRFVQHCPYDVQAVIKECWIDSGVVGKVPNRGYRDYWRVEEYDLALQELDEYQLRMAESGRVHSVEPFTYDSNDDWTTFDTRACARQMEAYPWRSASKPERTVLPVIKAPVKGDGLAFPIMGKSVTTQRFAQNPEAYKKYNQPGHNGWDMGADLGTPVVAIADGIVQFAAFDVAYGNYVRIFHKALGFHSFYAHLDTIREPLVGKLVGKGDVIGTVGSTGNSTGPHLHLEIRLALPDGNYAEGVYGYGKGRVDPQTVYHLLGGV